MRYVLASVLHSASASTTDTTQMYQAFAQDVLNDHQARRRRLKKVGIWTIQLAAQALFVGLAGNIA